MTEHTPTPWRAALEGNGFNLAVYVMAGAEEVCEVFDDSETSAMPAEANAEFIVKAVNCHDALVAALEAFRLKPDAIVSSQGNSITLRIPIEAIQQAAAALSLAKPEPSNV